MNVQGPKFTSETAPVWTPPRLVQLTSIGNSEGGILAYELEEFKRPRTKAAGGGFVYGDTFAATGSG